MSCAAAIMLYNLESGPKPTILRQAKSCEMGFLITDGNKTDIECDYIDINREVIVLSKKQIERYALTGDRYNLCTGEMGDRELYEI